MHWNLLDKRLKELWNCVADIYSDGLSFQTIEKRERRAMEIMEELTKKLSDKEDN